MAYLKALDIIKGPTIQVGMVGDSATQQKATDSDARSAATNSG
jgi:hypothetical protein